MQTLQELEAPIERRIASALIEATPESWRKARLEVDASEKAGMHGMSHMISSLEGRREVVAATDELTDATFELLELFKRHGKAWRRFVFEITEEGGSWRYVAHFDY